MSPNSAVFSGRSAATLAAAVCLLALAWSAAGVRAADGEAPPKPPKSVTVQAHVIMASRGKVPHVDDGLKHVADLLTGTFGRMFNRFRLHTTVSDDVKLEKSATLHLIEKYHLKTTYRGAADKNRKIQVAYSVVKRIQVTEDGKTKDKDIPLTTVNYTVPRGLFVTIAGPKVGDETMILAIRVLK
jgi:hypothetical protein